MRELVRRDPRSMFDSIDDFHRLFNSRMFEYPDRMAQVAPCDLTELDRHYVYTLDLPGVPKDEIKINVVDGLLTVSGERKTENTTQHGNGSMSEIYHGRFERTIRLPVGANEEKLEANYENGVLQIAIEKKVASTPRKYSITEKKGGGFIKSLLGFKKEIKETTTKVA